MIISNAKLINNSHTGKQMNEKTQPVGRYFCLATYKECERRGKYDRGAKTKISILEFVNPWASRG